MAKKPLSLQRLPLRLTFGQIVSLYRSVIALFHRLCHGGSNRMQIHIGGTGKRPLSSAESFRFGYANEPILREWIKHSIRARFGIIPIGITDSSRGSLRSSAPPERKKRRGDPEWVEVSSTPSGAAGNEHYRFRWCRLRSTTGYCL